MTLCSCKGKREKIDMKKTELFCFAYYNNFLCIRHSIYLISSYRKKEIEWKIHFKKHYSRKSWHENCKKTKWRKCEKDAFKLNDLISCFFFLFFLCVITNKIYEWENWYIWKLKVENDIFLCSERWKKKYERNYV